MATLPTSKFSKDKWVDTLNDPKFMEYFDKEWLSQEFKKEWFLGEWKQPKAPLENPIDYLDSLSFNDGELLITKRFEKYQLFPKNGPKYYIILNLTLREDCYWFTVDNKDYYNPLTFQIVDKRYTIKNNLLDVEYASPETCEKMRYKYLELVECIENRYDLSLEDLIMRF